MARKLTQSRIDELVKRHRPRGWRVQQSMKRWVSSSATTDYNKRMIYAPTLMDDDALFIFIHECGHIVLRHWHQVPYLAKHHEEFEAERYAIHIFRTENIPITKSIMADVRERLCWHIDNDIRRGVPIKRHIARWAKHPDFV